MSIYNQIGGKPAVEATVDRFYEIMLDDDRVKHFFTNTNMDKQKIHQRDFVTYALGGSSSYDGQNMREAHQGLVDKHGLNDEHFDATVENLVKAMQDLKVPENLISEVGAVLETVRSEVLCK